MLLNTFEAADEFIIQKKHRFHAIFFNNLNTQVH